MFLLLLSAAAAQPQTQARASVRIARPARVTEEAWSAAPRRTERIVRDQQGRPVRLRIIDFE